MFRPDLRHAPLPEHPAKLEIGYAGEIYHAWISVYTDETGWIDRLIEFSQGGWTRMDPTFASGKDNDSEILDYINDNSNIRPCIPDVNRQGFNAVKKGIESGKGSDSGKD